MQRSNSRRLCIMIQKLESWDLYEVNINVNLIYTALDKVEVSACIDNICSVSSMISVYTCNVLSMIVSVSCMYMLL